MADSMVPLKNIKYMKAVIIVFLMCILTIAEGFSQEKDWAFGARLGEPAGINIRKYRQENAFEVNIGTYGALWGGYRAYRKGHYDGLGLSVNVNYLWHGQLFNAETVKYYYGFGPQFNNRKYYPKVQNQSQGVASLSMGGNGAAGLEFYLSNSPISIFLETGLYVELIPKPVFLHPQGGAGLRFNL
jgi:hypothetical protein